MIVLGLVYRLSRWWPKLRPTVGIIGVVARAVAAIAVAAGAVVAGGVVASAVVALARRRAKSINIATDIEHLGSPAASGARRSAADDPQDTGEPPPLFRTPGLPPADSAQRDSAALPE